MVISDLKNFIANLVQVEMEVLIKNIQKKTQYNFPNRGAWEGVKDCSEFFLSRKFIHFGKDRPPLDQKAIFCRVKHLYQPSL